MKNFVYLPTLLAVLLLAGCAAPAPILLNDEAQIARLKQSPAMLPPKPRLSPSEVRQIEMEVFAWLLQRPIGDGLCSAVFLNTDEATTAALMKKIPAHVPPLKSLWHLETRTGQSPIDKDTGRAAVILSVDTLDQETTGTVVAVGKWFAGEATADFHTFELKKNGEDWRIETVK